MILFDSSVWIDALRGKKNLQVGLLANSIAENKAIALCPMIVQEVLQGIVNEKQFEETRTNLNGFIKLKIGAYKLALESAKLYRNLRKKGITVKAADCTIAYYAIHFEIPLIHTDKDYDLIAKHSKLKIHI